jgi:hypothetical protein
MGINSWIALGCIDAWGPLYGNGQHRDHPKLIAQWDYLLRRHNVDLYLSGHDHDLQHLEFKGHPTSFIIFGGGGAEPVGCRTPLPMERGPWVSDGARIYRFPDLRGGSRGETYRHGCDHPLRVQKASRHYETLLLRAAGQTTSSLRSQCICRTNDRAPIPVGESRSGASRQRSLW